MKQFLRMASIAVLILSVGCGGSSSSTTPQAATVTGSWSGSVASQVFVGTTTVTGNLTQGITNPDGSILFSGTLFFTGSCINTLTISGKIAGGAFALTGTFTDGTVLNVTATINAADSVITGSYADIGGTVCSTDHGTFTLNKVG